MNTSAASGNNFGPRLDALIRNLAPRHMLILLATCVAFFLLVGISAYLIQSKRTLEQETFRLTSISQLKTSQIESWLAERKDDAEVISRNPAFMSLLDSWLNGHDDNAGIRLRGWLELVKTTYGYANIELLDARRNLLIQTRKKHIEIDTDQDSNLFDQIRASGKTTITGIAISPDGSTHLHVLSGVRGLPGDTNAVLRITIDAQVHLTRILDDWAN
jgi:hypothetical protein